MNFLAGILSTILKELFGTIADELKKPIKIERSTPVDDAIKRRLRDRVRNAQGLNRISG